MATVSPSTSRAIALAIKNRLLGQNILPSRRVVIAARLYDWNAPKWQHFIAVRPIDLTVYQDWAESKGRHCTLVNRDFSVDIYTQLTLDDVNKDEDWTNDHFLYQDKVINALHIWLPTDGGGNSLTACPLHLSTVIHADKPTAVPGVGISQVHFNVDYILDLSQPFTDPAS